MLMMVMMASSSAFRLPVKFRVKVFALIRMRSRVAKVGMEKTTRRRGESDTDAAAERRRGTGRRWSGKWGWAGGRWPAGRRWSDRWRTRERKGGRRERRRRRIRGGSGGRWQHTGPIRNGDHHLVGKFGEVGRFLLLLLLLGETGRWRAGPDTPLMGRWLQRRSMPGRRMLAEDRC